MAFTFKLGSLDLSSYVRVGPQDGLDIYGSGWEEPVFSESAAAEGQPLISLDTRNREMVWPLFLKAASKDALYALKAQITREIRCGTRPLRVEWKSATSTNSTFYDVAHARLDEHTNFRLDEHNWTDVGLRVWCQPPWGHTGTYRNLATIAATGIFAMAVPSVAGDMNAQAVLDLQHSIGGASQVGIAIGMALIGPGYQHAYLPGTTAPSYVIGGTGLQLAPFNMPPATLTAATACPNLTALRVFCPSNALGITQTEAAQVTMPAASAFAGRNRVFALARTSSPSAGWALTLYGGGASGGAVRLVEPSSPYQFQATAWRLYDLGVVTVPSYPQSAFNFAIQAVASSAISASNGFVDYGAIYVMPEDTSRYYVDRDYGEIVNNVAPASGALHIAPEYRAVTRIYASQTTTPDGDQYMRGPELTIPPIPSQVLAGFMAPISSTTDNGGVARGIGNPSVNVQLAVRERFTFAR